jgi:Ca2+-binding EF-hand superfamily protein
MRTILLGSTVVLTAGLAGAALAQETGTGFCTADYMPHPRGAEGIAGLDERYASEFAEMDTDGDGMVSQAEFVACREAATIDSAPSDRSAENMAEADADADQQLTREEYLAAAAQAHGAVAASSDPGADAVEVLRRYVFVPASEPEQDLASMSAEEVAGLADLQFSALDTNQDDLIDMDEWQQTVATIRHRTAALIQSFGEMDEDASGTLTGEEYRAGMLPRDSEPPTITN